MLAICQLHTDTRIQFAFENAIYKLKGELHMDNIAEFILQTAEEAKRRGLEICIASVQVAPQKPESKPAVEHTAEPAKTPKVAKEAVREQHSRLRIAEAARMLRVSASCLYHRIEKGELKTEYDAAGYKTVPTSILQNFSLENKSPHSRQPIPVRCIQTGIVYPSMNAAADAMHVKAATISEAVRCQSPVKTLTFEKV